MASRLQRKFQNFTLSLDCTFQGSVHILSPSQQTRSLVSIFELQEYLLSVNLHLTSFPTWSSLGLRCHSFKIPKQETPVRLIQLPYFRGKKTEIEKIIAPPSDEKSTGELREPVQLFALLHKIHGTFICIYPVLSLYNQSVSSKKKRSVLKNSILPEMVI